MSSSVQAADVRSLSVIVAGAYAIMLWNRPLPSFRTRGSHKAMEWAGGCQCCREAMKQCVWRSKLDESVELVHAPASV